MDPEQKIIEAYKISRNSIEHFDKILGGFRQIIFAFNGIFVSSCLAFYLKYLSDQLSVIGTPKIIVVKSKIYLVLFTVNILFGGINILVWLLEKHYHRYLISSAIVAKNIERMLFGTEQNFRPLTITLEEARDTCFKYELKLLKEIDKYINSVFHRFSHYIRSYDLLYLLPIIGSIILNFVLSSRSLTDPEVLNKWLVNTIHIVRCIIPLVYSYIAFEIIKYNYWFNNFIKKKKKGMASRRH